MTSTTHDVPTAEAGPAEVHEVHARAAKARPLVLAFPTRTLPLLAILAGFGLVVLAFTYATVHRRTPQELATNPSSVRAQYEITYWLSHGYFSTGGVLVRSGAGGVPTLYRSSTGGALVTQFLVQKIYSLFAGYPSWGLLALTNQLLSLATSALLGLLGFRLARRIGAPPLHALAMAMAVQLVHFTFPDNLMVYWEMSGRVTFLLAACVFLLIEERRIDDPSRKLLIAQAVSASSS